jgi:hypothetical protein
MYANLPLRLARSAVFAVVCLTLTCVAHWFAGGAVPTPQVLLSGGLVVMTITAAATPSVAAMKDTSPTAASGSDGTARILGALGIVVGLLGAGIGVAGLQRSPRR